MNYATTVNGGGFTEKHGSVGKRRDGFKVPTYLALFALASWNSYDHSFPEDPIVLATECEKDPEPVPSHIARRLVRTRVQHKKGP